MAVPALPTAVAFDAAMAAAGGRIVAVDFTAAWCGPCQQIGPRFVAGAPHYPDCTFFKVDVDANAEVARRFSIASMPTFLFFRFGEELTRFSGASEAVLWSTLNRLRVEAVGVLRPGASVTVRGLSGAAHLNGRRGEVVAFDAARRRYTVRLEEGGDKSVAARNLEQEVGDVLAAGTAVVVQGLSSAPQYNGRPGEVLEWDGEAARYAVRISPSKTLRLKRDTVRAALSWPP